MSCGERRAIDYLRCFGDSRMKETPEWPSVVDFVFVSGIVNTRGHLAAAHT